MRKDELIRYLNDNTKGRKAGRKEFRTNDIFISSSSNTENFRLTSFGANIMKKHFMRALRRYHGKTILKIMNQRWPLSLTVSVLK